MKENQSSSKRVLRSFTLFVYATLIILATGFAFHQPAAGQVEPNGTLPPIDQPSVRMTVQPTTVITGEQTAQFTVTYATSPTVGSWTASFVFSNPIPVDLQLVTTSVATQGGGQLTVTEDLVLWKVNFPTGQRQEFTLTYKAAMNTTCVQASPIRNLAYLTEISNAQVITPAELPIPIATSLNLSVSSPFCSLMPLILHQPKPPLKPLTNGNFDDDNSGGGWQQVNGPIVYSGVNASITPQSSPNVAWLGGVANKVTAISQTFDLPPGYEISVKYYYRIGSVEERCSDSEVFRLKLDSTVLQTIQLCRKNITSGTTWKPVTLKLPLNAGSRVLTFEAQLNGKDNSNFFLDTISLCSDDTAAPAGTPKCN